MVGRVDGCGVCREARGEEEKSESKERGRRGRRRTGERAARQETSSGASFWAYLSLLHEVQERLGEAPSMGDTRLDRSHLLKTGGMEQKGTSPGSARELSRLDCAVARDLSVASDRECE